MNEKYNFREIEAKYRRNGKKIMPSGNGGSENEKYYVLEMFPYPSGKSHVRRNYH